MIKIYYFVCGKQKNHAFTKTLGLFIVCNKCGYEYKKILKAEETTEILIMISLITNMKEISKNI